MPPSLPGAMGTGRPRGDPAAEPDVTAASSVTPAAARTSGTVTGAPRRWLRLEAAVLLAGSLIAFSATHQPWWLVPLTILVPDVLAAGYLGGTRLGAHLYSLVWLAHIGADRLLGYGLKYGDTFQHTHLGQLGRPGGTP